MRTAAQRNVRALVLHPNGIHQSPDPPRQGDTPTRPARQQIFTSLAIAPYHAVMKDDFFVLIEYANQGAAIPRGAQLAFVERANIHRPAAEAYGSLFELRPPDPYSLLR